MPGPFHHEKLYRGESLVARLAAARLTLCGAGAVGSNLADNLVRQGARRLRVIDHDRVEEHNVSTQAYASADVGAWKVESLRARLFRVAGVEIDAVCKELNEHNAHRLIAPAGTDLVIDAFDNSRSRELVQQHCRAAGVPCLHIGLAADYAEVIWNADYRVPRDVGGEVCDYPLARNLVLLSVAVAAETILRFLAEGREEGWTITLRDLRCAAHINQG